MKRKKLAKGLRLRGDTIWGSITVGGKQNQFSTGFTRGDEKKAERLLNKLKNEVAEGRWFGKLVGEYKSVRDLLAKYLKDISSRKAPATQRRDKSLAANLERIIGKHSLVKASPQVVSDYIGRRVKGRVNSSRQFG